MDLKEYSFARLDDIQLKKIQELEQNMSNSLPGNDELILIAYKKENK